MIGGVNQIDAPQPRIGTGNVFEISTLSEKCFYLSYSMNSLQALSPGSRQHAGEPDLELENIDVLSDGESYFLCVSVATSARMFWVPMGSGHGEIAPVSTGQSLALSRTYIRK